MGLAGANRKQESRYSKIGICLVLDVDGAEFLSVIGLILGAHRHADGSHYRKAQLYDVNISPCSKPPTPSFLESSQHQSTHSIFMQQS